jgi:hypothetical protein|tara:strand:+ start:1179 stop:1697 length:519 start_codon:yes stop_codon:yes gene_type:complete
VLSLKKIPNYTNKITVNYSSKLFSNSINTSKPVFLPNSTHQVPTVLSAPTYYLIEFKEQTTGKVYDTLLPLAGYSSNARYIMFDLRIDLANSETATRTGVIGLENSGKYDYNIYGVIENTQYPADTPGISNKNARVLIDKGVAMVYDSYDFTNTYYNPDRQTIPTVISYKNE